MKNLIPIFLFLLTTFPLSGQSVPELYLIVDAEALGSYYPRINSHDNRTLSILQTSRVNIKDVLTLTNIDFCQNGSYKAFKYELENIDYVLSRELVVDSKGNFYISGSGTRSFIMKVKKDFTPAWCFYFKDSLSVYLSPLSINNNDELLVTGGAYSPLSPYSCSFKIDTSGNVLQGLKFSNQHFGAYENLATADGGWLMANSKYIIKTDSNLNQQWVSMIDQSIHLGGTPVETNDGYFLVYEKFSTDQIIGIFIDKKGNYKWSTGLLENHHFGEAYALEDNSILLYSNKYSGNSSSIDYAKQVSIIYNTSGQLQSYMAFNQKDGYLKPYNTSAKLFKFREELLFCRSIGWTPPLPFVRTVIGLVPFSKSSNCLTFHNSPPKSLPFPISMQKVQNFATTNFVLPQESIPVTMSNYRHDSIIQLCPRPGVAGNLNFPDTLKICEGDTIEMFGLSQGQHYWSTGDTTLSIEISQKGQYFLKVEDRCGQIVQQDSFIVKTVSPLPFRIFGDSTTYTFDEVLFSNNLGHKVRWFINDKFRGESSSLKYSFSQPGTYQVRADYLGHDSACHNTALFTIEVLAGDINFPNVFTPNGDGTNDFFRSLEAYHKPYHIDIYNRYGSQVATVNQNGWNGRTTNDKPAAEGVYFYIVKINGESEDLKGFLTLMR